MTNEIVAGWFAGELPRQGKSDVGLFGGRV